MSELGVLPGLPAPDPQAPRRTSVVVHRMDGGLETGESEARALSAAGFPIYTTADPDRPRLIPLSDIKYVVLGSVEDPNLEPDPGDRATTRKAILRFRDGEWIPAYMDPSQANDGVGVAVKIRLTERGRVIPAVAASRALLEMQFVDVWTTPSEGPTPQRRRSDIELAAARQGKDLHKLANDFRDRLALVRDAGLTTGDTLAFSRAVRTYLDRFLAEDNITLTAGEKSALADIILRAAVGYGPLDPLLHDRSVSEIMVNGPDQVFIERRGVLAKAEVRFDDENQQLESRDVGVPEGRGARSHECPGVRRHRLGQDDDVERHRALHPAQPARDHHRGRGRAADRSPARHLARAPPAKRRRQGRADDPTAPAQQPAHATRPNPGR